MSVTLQAAAGEPTFDLADHFLACAKLGRFLTVLDGRRFVLTDDFAGDRWVPPVATAMASVYSKDPLVAQAAIMPLARRADRVDTRTKDRYGELFDIIEREAINPEVKESAHLLLDSGFRLARIKSLEAELGGRITPARLRYFKFLSIIRQLTEGGITPAAFQAEFVDFTQAVAGRLDFGIYSFCLDRIFGDGRIPLAAKQLIVDELLKFPPLVRRELLTNVLVTNAGQADLCAYVRNAVGDAMSGQRAMEVQLLEQVKCAQLTFTQVESLLGAKVN